MKAWGLALAAIGTIIAVGALFMSTSAPLEVPSTPFSGLPSTSEVYNLGLLRNQLFVFLTGCTVFVAGVVMACVGQLAVTRSTDLMSHGRLDGQLPLVEEPQSLPSATVPAPMTPEQVAEAQRSDRYMYALIAGVVAVIAIVLVIASVTGKSPPTATAAAIEANADALVDNMELVADNMDAIADNSSAIASPASSSAVRRESHEAVADAGTDEPTATTEMDGNTEIGRDNWAGE